jgi:preprotein translocase subunit SecE
MDVMASKLAMANGDDQPIKRQGPKFYDGAMGTWNSFTSFLSDVRAEMRKVVTPTRKEVQATTSVVIVTVFLFGFFFLVVDRIFGWSLQAILHRLGGTQ